MSIRDCYLSTVNVRFPSSELVHPGLGVYQFFSRVYLTVCSVLCKFFMHGACLKGSDCMFSHNWNDQASQVRTEREQLAAAHLSPIDRI